MPSPARTSSLRPPPPTAIATRRLIRQAAADHGLVLPDPHASLGTADQIADTLDNLGLLLCQVDERRFSDLLDADPRTAYDHWLEYGFIDQLRNAPPATADAIYDGFQCELQTAGTAQHVAMFTLYFLALTLQIRQGGISRTWYLGEVRCGLSPQESDARGRITKGLS